MCKKQLSKISTIVYTKPATTFTMPIDCFEIEWAAFHQVKQDLSPTVPAATKKSEPFVCDSCQGRQIFNEDNLPVCTSCGVVVSSWIDDGPEWINGTNEDGTSIDRARCGPAADTDLFSAQWGSGTVMSSRGKQTAASRRIARINFHQSMNHKDRSLFHAYKSIDIAAVDKLKLPESTVRGAKIMYRKFTTEKLTRGQVRTGIKANCIFYACKLDGFSRTTKEVADAFGIPTKDLSRTSELFRNVMLKETEKVKDKSTSGVTNASDVISRLLNEFDIENRRFIHARCIKFHSKISDCVELMGKTPTSVASVIILKVLEGKVTKQDIVQKCNISMPTLNKIEGIINKYLEASNK